MSLFWSMSVFDFFSIFFKVGVGFGFGFLDYHDIGVGFGFLA